MRMKTMFLLAVLAPCGCDRTEVLPTESPTLAPYEGLVAIAMHTDRPVLTVHYVSPDNELQFNLTSVDAGTSMQVHRVPAGEYCVRYVTWPVTTFHADHLDAGPILCMTVQPGVLNYPGHLQFADGESNLARSLFHARYVPVPEDFGRRIHEDYPELVPMLARCGAACNAP